MSHGRSAPHFDKSLQQRSNVGDERYTIQKHGVTLFARIVFFSFFSFLLDNAKLAAARMGLGIRGNPVSEEPSSTGGI